MHGDSVRAVGAGRVAETARARLIHALLARHRIVRAGCCLRWGHGPFRGRAAPHDDVRVGRLNVCSGVQSSRHQPNERGRHNTVPAGHRQSGRPDQELYKIGSGFLRPAPVERCAVDPDAVQKAAILRAMATFAFLMPILLASFIPQALSEDHFFVR